MQEGLPNVAVEAGACGRAVLASNVGGLPEAVRDGQTGILLPAGNVAIWKEALSENAKQHCRLQAMGSRARDYVESQFDSREYPRRMMDLYEAALTEPIRPTITA
jgi:glycosyltransferase involved in cell wall biosynthesis